MIKQIPITMHPNAFAAFGPDLVTNDVVALMELIKNSYDAYAYHVDIVFGNNDGDAFIEVSDDGVGMTRDTIENVWAVVATPYKRKHPTISRGGSLRRVSGNKGMGRFSAARLGDKLDIYTKHQDDAYLHVSIDWVSFLDPDRTLPCSIQVEELDHYDFIKNTGTRIVISELKNIWAESDLKELQDNLSRIMSPFEEVSDFSMTLAVASNTLANYKSSSIKILPPAFISTPIYRIIASVDETGNVTWEYDYKNPHSLKTRKDKGRIPWNDIFAVQIATDVTSLKKTQIDAQQASCGPFSLEIRAWDLDVDSIQDIADAFDINKGSVRSTLRAYKGISIYRDGVLVLPKSEASRDWIGLDTRRISDIGKRMSTSQMLGIVRIGADSNPEIRDTTDREKLVDTKENIEFCAIIKSIIGQLENMRDMDRERKRKEPALVDVFSALSPEKLVTDAEQAVTRGQTASEVLQLVRDYEFESRSKIDDVRNRLYYFGQVATAGSMASFILHEIRGGLTSIKRFLGAVEKYLHNFDGTTVDYYRISQESHARMMLVANSFAPLYSTGFKKKSYTCNLKKEIEMSLSFLNEKIEKSNIVLDCEIPDNITVGLHPGELQTIIVNLVDNAIYWIDQACTDERRIGISICQDSNTNSAQRLTMKINDTGTGVLRENAEKIFEPGVTSKAHGIGMGLVIVAEVLARHQGKIAVEIPGELSGATFVFDIPTV